MRRGDAGFGATQRHETTRFWSRYRAGDTKRHETTRSVFFSEVLILWWPWLAVSFEGLACHVGAGVVRHFRVVSCRFVSFRVFSCRFVSFRVVSCRFVSFSVVSCLSACLGSGVGVVSFRVVSCLCVSFCVTIVVSFRVVSCRFVSFSCRFAFLRFLLCRCWLVACHALVFCLCVSFRVVSCRFVSFRVFPVCLRVSVRVLVSCRFVSFRVVSCRFVSFRVVACLCVSFRVLGCLCVSLASGVACLWRVFTLWVRVCSSLSLSLSLPPIQSYVDRLTLDL